MLLAMTAFLTAVAPGQAAPPKGATVLFDGKSTSAWEQYPDKSKCKWTVQDGALCVAPGSGAIRTKAEFKDFRLHVEFWLPLMADQTSQGRANSGVFSQARYEIQVLDSYNNPTYKAGGC